MKQNFPVTQKEISLSDDCVILSTTDAKGQITYVNDEFISYSGFEEEELLGKSHNIVRHPDMPPEVFENLWTTLKSGKPWMGIIKNRCKNGDHYWVDAIVTPIVKDGHITEYQSIRTKASIDDVKRAERIYQDISAKKLNLLAPLKSLGIAGRLTTAFCLSLLPMITALLVATDIKTLWLIVATLVSLAMGTGLIFWATRHIRKVTKYAKEIVNNPLVQQVYTGRNDESAQLKFAMRMLQKKFHSVSGRIHDSTKHLQQSSFQLGNAVSLNRKGVSHQESESAKLLEAMTELHSTSTEVSNNVQSSSQNLEQVAADAGQGQVIVNEAVEQMNRLWTQVDESKDVIISLELDSKNIGNILDVIKGIAEQTNLLALNAAIEAARAGEQGRGFAVVADEVRTLASRTQESTRHIEQMIAQLQTRTHEVVTTMSDSRKLADISVDQITEAGTALSSISSTITQIAHHHTQINHMSQGQLEFIDNVSSNVAAINEINELAVETAVDLEAIAEDVNELSTSLEQLLTSLSR